jgi:hypothetical protein
MNWKTYVLLTGIIFALVALAHALRIYMDWPVMIADWSVPKSISWIASSSLVGSPLSHLGSSRRTTTEKRGWRAAPA